jgi:hypothetical protein
MHLFSVDNPAADPLNRRLCGLDNRVEEEMVAVSFCSTPHQPALGQA